MEVQAAFCFADLGFGGFGGCFDARYHQGVQAAVVGAGNIEQQIAQLHFFAAHGQVPQFVDNQPADGIGLVAAVLRTEIVVDVADLGFGMHSPAFG